MECGKANETDVISTLNNRRFEDLNSKWKSHVKRMFPEIKDSDLLRAYFYDDPYAKPDIVIKAAFRKIYLSIKSGHNPSCHNEAFVAFMAFLKKSQVPERYLRIISFFHFGESDKASNNGKPFTKSEIEEKYGSYLKELNEYLQTRKDLTEKMIYRAIIRGTRSNANEIDYFYYGNVNNGFLLSRCEIYDFIINDRTGKMDGAPRFGSLVYQPHGRKEGDKNQEYIRIKWPILCVKYYDQDFVKKHS